MDFILLHSRNVGGHHDISFRCRLHSCYYSPIQQYYGKQCELLRWGSGFYAVLFGALGVALLLFCVCVVAIVVLRRRRRRRHSLDEDYFNFINTGLGSGGLPGRSGLYELDDSVTFANEFPPGVFSPSLEYVDTSMNVTIRRPELILS
ncbi:hypothetical protein COCON_G00139990 [Conger conger]|uniref:Uncharacterized protein n=1 Tax=Conger conger TaxID=82655 RepID=A0A9Q1DB33_CONCO|nr:hypothetical protein COCON_G00139990 [Conger conger]